MRAPALAWRLPRPRRGHPRGAAQSDHKTSPFCWLETTSGKVPKAGRDRICEWAAETFVGDDATKKKIVAFANTMPKKPPSNFVAFHCPKPGITGTLP